MEAMYKAGYESREGVLGAERTGEEAVSKDVRKRGRLTRCVPGPKEVEKAGNSWLWPWTCLRRKLGVTESS